MNRKKLPPPSEKLQKVLAQAGLGSRRALERRILAGRVSVNGARAELGARVSPGDRIRVDGRPIPRSDVGGADGVGIRVLRYHKPAGEICSRADPEGRRSVFDRLPHISPGRWIAVGRLDIGTRGLLLFTNAGELAHRLMHPASGMEREYAVRVLPCPSTTDPATDTKPGQGDAGRTAGDPAPANPHRRAGPMAGSPASPALLDRLRAGIRLEDGPARFERIVDVGGQGQNHWYHIVIKEGKTHEVRRLWEAVGFRVSRLIRVRYGPIRLARGLRAGRWEELPAREVAELLQCVGLGDSTIDKAGSRRPRHGRSGKYNVPARPVAREEVVREKVVREEVIREKTVREGIAREGVARKKHLSGKAARGEFETAPARRTPRGGPGTGAGKPAIHRQDRSAPHRDRARPGRKTRGAPARVDPRKGTHRGIIQPGPGRAGDRPVGGSGDGTRDRTGNRTKD